MKYELPFGWSNQHLWELDLPVTQMPASKLVWIFRLDEDWRSVMEAPDSNKHWRRARRADVSYPIHVLRYRSRWWILDGMHRFMALYYIHHLRVVSVQKVPMDLFRKVIVKGRHGGGP